MAKGWIRSWSADDRVYFRVLRNGGRRLARDAQANFRREFSTSLHAAADEGSTVLRELAWNAEVGLPEGIADDEWTPVEHADDNGFVRSDHLVEIAYVNVDPAPGASDDPYQAELLLRNGDTVDLLWGDLVQVLQREGGKCKVRARGFTGTIATDRLCESPVLEVYFIDVGQGDGVLVRTPAGRHVLIDGGLPRRQQQTGKNAADFVDWKWFVDYGDYKVRLDDVVASHSDLDHYGGLCDLLDPDDIARRELDTLGAVVRRFAHPGLSRWESRPDAVPAHHDGLGPLEHGFYTRLLGDRADAEACIVNNAPMELSRPWRELLKFVLDSSTATTVERLGVRHEDLVTATALPVFHSEPELVVHVLGPVTVDQAGRPALKDFGKKSYNTNGHSVCLRIDYRNCRLLLTGDLNKASMDWLRESYGDHRMGEWACDVAKACHHGSHDISYKFLEKVRAGATVISSGDNEGYAHPRPEVVAASAMTGYKKVDRATDRLVTPLIYMTEIERSVALAEVNRFELNPGPAGQPLTVLTKPLAEFTDSEYLSADDLAEIEQAAKEERTALRRAAVQRQKPLLKAAELAQQQTGTKTTYAARMPVGVVGATYPHGGTDGLRVMHRNNYGLVNVRTDGRTVMLASKRDSGERWTVHTFKARF